jgi:MerR family transcriptional regulator, light-induced transcriptional regulator
VTTAAPLRIGELSKRSGVSPHVLRAWERRYGLLRPTRSSGGLRLYSPEDLQRVRLMREHLGQGVAAAEAAALVTGAASGGAAAGPAIDSSAARRDLGAALESFDESRANALIDGLLAVATIDVFLRDVVLPYLHELGERWERGEASVAQEHFASNVLHGRLLGLGRDWGRGIGPRALLACLPGEEHELGLIAFGLALRSRGWRIAYLGADTPLETLENTAVALEPDLIAVSAVATDRVEPLDEALRRLAQTHTVVIGGVGANGAAAEWGVVVLNGDPVSAAEHVGTLLLTPEAR